MKKLFLAFLMLATPLQAAPPVTVLNVHDGDTFSLAVLWTPYKLRFSVRLLANDGGIDTPEIGSRAQCEQENQLAIQAREFAKARIAESGNQVWLERVSHDRNGGRILANAILRINNRRHSLGDLLIENNLAVRYNGTGERYDWCSPVLHPQGP